MTTRESVAAAMREQAVTIAELARRTGIANPHLSRWLAGKAALGSDRLDRVLDALGLAVAPRGA